MTSEQQKKTKEKELSLDTPSGQVALNSPFYVERSPIESECYETIMNPGALIRVKAPRQMGKTSLMSRILNYAEQQGYCKACLNFQSADEEFLTNLDLFLKWFCASITDELNLEEKLYEYWQGVLGSKNKCTNYFQRYLLSEISTPLVLGLDEVDQVFQHPEIATSFFALLRTWHERGKNEAVWQKLRLVIVHSKEVYIPLNINQSPFNVGLPIELRELNWEEVENLVKLHHLEWSSEQIKELMAMVGGHPYLVRQAIQSQDFKNLVDQVSPVAVESIDIANEEELDKALELLWGSRRRRGKVSRWVYERLTDSSGTTFPRSLSLLLEGAKEQELTFRGKSLTQIRTERLLQGKSLEFGLKEASKKRCQEIKEEYPYLINFFDSLKGKLAFLTKEELQEIWQNLPEKILENFEEFISLMGEIGIIEFWEKEKRYKFADIYVYGFEIIRQGTV
ncbi:MAG: hypothetical protein F6K34_19530 [Okeania sp. SIO4D6]|nr:hypothetical protein [Okeania sp. SIO4D6]